jgi:MFS transporter, DHA2 family, glioxin efflux transporter
MVPVNVVQAKLTGTKDLEIGTAIVIFFQTLGGCLFVSISESVYQNKLFGGLSSVLPNDQVQQIIAGGLTGFRSVSLSLE